MSNHFEVRILGELPIFGEYIMVISNRKEFVNNWMKAKDGDLCLIPVMDPIKAAFMQSRGVRLAFDPLCCLLHNSKVSQTQIFSSKMPYTRIVYSKGELYYLLMDHFAEHQEPLIIKNDRGSGGNGVFLFTENSYDYNGISYPCVVQKYLPGYHDIRVIIIGDYFEAYERVNELDFRKNIARGGKSTPVGLFDLKCRLDDEATRIVKLGKFPYAHIDFMVNPDSHYVYFSEISLGGGIQGSKLSYNEIKRLKHNHLIETLMKGK